MEVPEFDTNTQERQSFHIQLLNTFSGNRYFVSLKKMSDHSNDVVELVVPTTSIAFGAPYRFFNTDPIGSDRVTERVQIKTIRALFRNGFFSSEYGYILVQSLSGIVRLTFIVDNSTNI